MSDEEFVKLYEQHAKALWCFVLSRLPQRDANMADDVCQETWLRARQKLEQFRSGSNFKAWLFKIAKNLLLDESRKKATLSLPNGNDPPDSHATNTLEAMIDQERKAVVAECMKTLAQQEADVVKMRTAGLSYEEIARALNVTVERAHTLYHQGKNKLKSCVERKLP